MNLNKEVVKMIKKCAICRKEKEMTFEHVPPKSTGNNFPITQYSALASLTDIKIKPWEFEKMKWDQIKQKGQGYTNLCRDCNSFLGTWYVKKYNAFISQLKNPTNFQRLNEDTVEVAFNNIYPLEIFKQILSMFMTINIDNYLFKKECTNYLLNKESQKKPKKLDIYTYINNGSLTRYNPYQIMGIDNDLIITSELGLETLGYIIYHKVPSNYKIDCTDISFFNSFKFNESVSFSLILKVKEVNSIISNDFRKMSEFQ